MRILLFVLISFVIGCASTSDGKKTKTLNTSNLQKTSAGTYKFIEKPKEQKVPAEIKKSSPLKDNPILKIHWFSFIVFYIALACTTYLLWLVWSAYERYRTKDNPFKEKKTERQDLP